MVNWDEPPTRGISDRQAERPIARCSFCGYEIYAGDEALTDGGDVELHTDCLMDWVKDLGIAAVAEAFGFETLRS